MRSHRIGKRSADKPVTKRKRSNGTTAKIPGTRNPKRQSYAGRSNSQEERKTEIAFYRANERPYGVFSNLYKRPIFFEGTEFPTAEHAYQAGKPVRQEVREWLLSAPTPALLAMAAHGLYTWDIRPDWASVKYKRMRDVLYAKFSQHPDLMQLLLSTDSARLVEKGRVANAVNKTWGEVNGKGLNMLGQLLMEVRTQLRNQSSTSQVFVGSTTRKRGSSHR